MPYDGTQLNETAAHLLRAKQYIYEHGGCQLRFEAWKRGPVCILGALSRTSGEKSFASVYQVIDTFSIPSLLSFNDTPGRTVEEIYAAFDRAIALAMEAGVAIAHGNENPRKDETH